MAYSPGYIEPVLPMVATNGAWAWTNTLAAPTSAAYEAANRAVYAAVVVPTTCVVRRVWWANGATVSATYNVDVGVYADAGFAPGARLVSAGSTAQGTASQVQFVDVTDTTLAPGLYWVGLSCSSASATFFRNSVQSATSDDATLRYQEATALPLPATATPVETGSPSYLYLCGFATTASP